MTAGLRCGVNDAAFPSRARVRISEGDVVIIPAGTPHGMSEWSWAASPSSSPGSIRWRFYPLHNDGAGFRRDCPHACLGDRVRSARRCFFRQSLWAAAAEASLPPGTPRLARWKARFNVPAPKTADESLDLSGVWESQRHRRAAISWTGPAGLLVSHVDTPWASSAHCGAARRRARR